MGRSHLAVLEDKEPGSGRSDDDELGHLGHNQPILVVAGRRPAAVAADRWNSPLHAALPLVINPPTHTTDNFSTETTAYYRPPDTADQLTVVSPATTLPIAGPTSRRVVGRQSTNSASSPAADTDAVYGSQPDSASDVFTRHNNINTTTYTSTSVVAGRYANCVNNLKTNRRVRNLALISHENSASSSSSNNSLSCFVINAHSLTQDNKFQQLCADVTANYFHIIVVTETWFKQKHNDSLFNIDGYTLFRRDRIGRRSGGVCIYASCDLNPTVIDINHQAPSAKHHEDYLFTRTMNIIYLGYLLSAQAYL